MRLILADTLKASQTQAASVWTSVEVDFDNIERVRTEFKARFKKETGASLSYLPFISRAVCDALRQFPTVNSSIDLESKTMTLHPYVNLGVAVDLDEQGLVVPVVKDADTLNIRGIASQIATKAAAARAKELPNKEMQGSTFTITNPGPFSSYASSPIINQPNVAILCTDGVKRRPVAVGDAIAIHPVGIIGMVYDHRAFDGSTASKFLAAPQGFARAAGLVSRAQLIAVRPGMSEAESIDDTDGAVTVLVARRVVPGKEIEFEKWASELTRAASSFDGFLGAGLLQPGHVGELWHVVYRFASADELARWEQSQTRSDLLAHRRAGDVDRARAANHRARDVVRSARPHRTRTSPVEDVRRHFRRDLRAPADAESGSAANGFAHCTGAEGGVDLVHRVGVDDVDRSAAVGGAARTLAVCTSAFPLTRRRADPDEMVRSTRTPAPERPCGRGCSRPGRLPAPFRRTISGT